MRDEWPTVQIGDVAQIFDGPHATPPTIDWGPLFLGIGSLDNGRLDLSSTRHLAPEHFVQWTRRVRPQGGDVVFSYETRIGQAAIIPEGMECCLGRRMGLIRVSRTCVDPHFLLYQYLAPQFQDLLRSRTVQGATVDRILLTEFPSFPIALPPLPAQQRIAKVLKALDDKIDLNRRMNETLDAMARAIFKDWFVDFGPTRAKMAGLAPYLSETVWKIFPEKMSESEAVPEGWPAVPVSELGIARTEHQNPEAFPSEWFDHYSLPAYDEGQTPVRQTGSEIRSNKFLVPPNAILVSKLNPEIPRVWLTDTTPDVPSVCSTEFLPFLPTGRANRAFVYHLFADEKFRAGLVSLVTGTSKSHQRAGLASILQLTAVMPSPQAMEAFGDLVAPLHARVAANKRENVVLTQSRDFLLPRLLSGEITVRDADQTLEAAL